MKPRSGFYVRRPYLSFYLVLVNWNATLMLKRQVQFCEGFTLQNHYFERHYQLNWCKTETDLSADCCRKQDEHVLAHWGMNAYYCLPVHAEFIFTGDLVSGFSHFPALWSGRGRGDEGPWERGWSTDSFLIYMPCEWLFSLTFTMNIVALVVVVIVSAIWWLVFTKQNKKM